MHSPSLIVQGFDVKAHMVSLSHQIIERELWQIKRNLSEEIRTQGLGQNPFIGGKVLVPSRCNNGTVMITVNIVKNIITINHDRMD